MIIKYYPHLNNTHNLKVWEFEILEIQNMFNFMFLEFQESLLHVNGV